MDSLSEMLRTAMIELSGPTAGCYDCCEIIDGSGIPYRVDPY